MTDVVKSIRAALESKLSSVSGVPRVAYENVRFDPAVGETYVKASVLPTLSRPVTVGLAPQVRHEGLFSLLVCAPEGKGVGPAQTIVDIIMAAFAPSTDAVYGTTRVSLDFVEPARGFSDTPYYCIPVNIGWHTYN